MPVANRTHHNPKTGSPPQKSPAPQTHPPDTHHTPLAVLLQRFNRTPTYLTPHEMLQLQRLVGNRAVAQRMASARSEQPVIQRKITVGDEVFEQGLDFVPGSWGFNAKEKGLYLKMLNDEIDHTFGKLEEMKAAIHKVVRGFVIDPGLEGQISAADTHAFQAAPSLAVMEQQLVEMMKNRGLQFEIGGLYSEYGAKMIKKGVASGHGPGQDASVEFTEEDIQSFDTGNLVMTHNHPFGAPLSDSDIRVGIGRGLKEIRAVTVRGVFSFARTRKSWGDLTGEKVIEAFTKGWKQQKPKSDQDKHRVKLQYHGARGQTGSTFAEDFFLSKHYAAKHLAVTYPGITYTHPDEAGLMEERLTYYEPPLKLSSEAPAVLPSQSVGKASSRKKFDPMY